MKINPVISSLNFYKGSYVKPQVAQNPVNASQLQQIKELSNVFYYPLSFTGSERTVSSSKHNLKEYSGDFLVSKFNDVPCPACGKKMMNKTLFHKIEDDLSKLQPEEYLDYIRQYTDYMRPVEKSVYNELLCMSDFSSEKDIRTLVCKLRDAKLPLLQEIQKRQVRKMKALAKTLPENEKALLLDQAKGIEKHIYKKNEEAPFRRKIMLEGISKLHISNPYKKKKLQQIASEFPVSSDMNSAWIVKYSGKDKRGEDWSSKDIAARLLSTSVANTDHILAYSIENNHDDISNYMSMHNGCNSKKADKPFLQWLNEDKQNRINYMQKYFEHVDMLIKTKKLNKKKYRHYVAYATETIFEASKGQVKISVGGETDAEKTSK